MQCKRAVNPRIRPLRVKSDDRRGNVPTRFPLLRLGVDVPAHFDFALEVSKSPCLKSSSRRKEALAIERVGPKKPRDLSLLTSAATTEVGLFQPALSDILWLLTNRS